MKTNWHIISEHRDELFGVAILGVFCVHSNGFKWSQGMETVVKLLSEGSIGVDIFLFLSGMGLYYSMKKDDSITQFYLRRFRRIVPVYLLTAGIGYANVILILQRGSFGNYLFRLSTLSFWTTGEGTVWYISFILITYLLYPLVYKILQFPLAGWIVSLIIILILFGNIGIATLAPEIFSNIEAALDRIMIFIIGCFCATKIYNNQEIKYFEIF